MVNITKINEVYIGVHCVDSAILINLVNHFKFTIPNARYHPLVKKGIWDGSIRLLDRNKLYRGLFFKLLHFCIKNNYAYKFDDELWLKDDTISIADLNKFIDTLNLPSSMIPRDYQINAIKKSIDDNRVLLISPTASGKSLIIYILLRWHLLHGRKCLIMTPTTSLVEQMYGDFAEYGLEDNSFNLSDKCQRLYSGLSKEINKDVLITTWQSIHAIKDKKFINDFDVIFGDEAHTFKAKSLVNIMVKSTGIKYRIGTTGTLDGVKSNEFVLQGLFGEKFIVENIKNLIDKGYLSKVRINIIRMDYDNSIKKEYNKLKSIYMATADKNKLTDNNKLYLSELDMIFSNKHRNKFIMNLLSRLDGLTLILFQYIDKHGKVMFDLHNEEKTENKCYFVSGKSMVDARENVRKIADKNQGDKINIFASVGVFSTGINIPSIRNIIFTSPSKSKIRIAQSIGRGARKFGDEYCDVYDLVDNINKKNYAMRHYHERLKMYASDGFEIKKYKIYMG